MSLYHADCGLLTEDGGYLYIPFEGEKRYTLDFYGGRGKNHTVEVADPDMLGVSYVETDVRDVLFEESEVTPAGIVLHPYTKGDTSVTVTDEDTGESVQLNVHIRDAYHAIEVYDASHTFGTGTVLAFRYGGVDDVLKICKKNASDGSIRHVADGCYRFEVYDNELCMEVLFNPDENGKPSSEGQEKTKFYKIRSHDGWGWSSSVENIILHMNIEDYPIFSRTAEEYHEYRNEFEFVGITADPYVYERFFACSAVLIPWIAD